MDLNQREDSEVFRHGEKWMNVIFQHLKCRYEQTRDNSPKAIATVVSYPAKWPGSVRNKVIEAAKKAGFPSVSGMTEPEAAMRAFVYNRKDELTALADENGKLRAMLLDMGAGTTDIIIFTTDFTKDCTVDIHACYPPSGAKGTFGGREMDKLLFEWIKPLLPSDIVNSIQKNLPPHLEVVKEWKERGAKDLSNGDAILKTPRFTISDETTYLKKLATPISRERLTGEIAADHLPILGRMMTEAIDMAKEETRGAVTPESIDVVLLTGGHSRWFFVRDMVLGRLPDSMPSGFTLKKIMGGNERVYSDQGEPETTVAKGLALSEMPVKVKLRTSQSVWLNLSVDGCSLPTIKLFDTGGSLPSRSKLVMQFDATERYFTDLDAIKITSQLTVGNEYASGRKGISHAFESECDTAGAWIELVFSPLALVIKTLFGNDKKKGWVAIESSLDKNEDVRTAFLVLFQDKKISGIITNSTRLGTVDADQAKRLMQAVEDFAKKSN